MLQNLLRKKYYLGWWPNKNFKLYKPKWLDSEWTPTNWFGNSLHLVEVGGAIRTLTKSELKLELELDIACPTSTKSVNTPDD